MISRGRKEHALDDVIEEEDTVLGSEISPRPNIEKEEEKKTKFSVDKKVSDSPS